MENIGNIILGILIPFAGTTLGAACVYFMKKGIRQNVEKGLLGFASGVMVAASVWSLLIPSMNLSADLGRLAFLPAVTGFFCGILFLLFLDGHVPHLHIGCDEPEGPSCTLKKNTMLVLAVTLHNIPEGMAVGVMFAGLLTANSGITLAGAFALSVGIAIQNFPEGAIISLPLKGEGMSSNRAFLYGTLSGVVEPVAALLTVLLYSPRSGPAVSSRLRCRCHDVRGRGGADPGDRGGRALEYRNHRVCGWICPDDDAGCGTWVIQ